LLSFRFLRHSQFGALARYTFFSTGDLGSPVCFLFVFPRPFSALARFNFFGLRQLGARILASTSSVPAVSTLCPKGASSTTSSVKPGLLGADDESLIVPVRSAEGQISSISGPSLRAIW